MSLPIEAAAEFDGHNLVFVVGCPRSGTTWVQRLLASHPQVVTGQESDLFDMYIGPQLRAWRAYSRPGSSGRGIVGLACYMDEGEFLTGLRQYMEALLKPMLSDLHRDHVFVEKTPSHALYLREIFELLPKSTVVHVIRDPRATVASLLAAGRTWGKSWAPRNARAASLMWLKHVRAARQAFQDIPRKQAYEVRFEDLHGQTNKVLGQLFAFLGLEMDNCMLAEAVERNRADISGARHGTEIPLKGIARKHYGSHVRDPRGFVRNGSADGWRRDLSLTQTFVVRRVTRTMMRDLGYA